MRTMSVHHLNLVITGAGDSDLLEMTFDEIGKRLSVEQPHALWPIENLLRQSLSEIFKKYIGPYSVFPEGDRDRPMIPDFLIGIQMESATLLYKANGTKLRRLHEGDCVGTGLVLGKSMIARLLRSEMTLTQTGLIAVYLLHQVKRWVDGCGGKSDILLLSNTGRKIVRMPTNDIENLEKHFDEFDRFMLPVMIAAADGTVSHADYEKAVQDFKINIFTLRGKFMEMEQFFRHLYEIRGLPLPKELKKFIEGE